MSALPLGNISRKINQGGRRYRPERSPWSNSSRILSTFLITSHGPTLKMRNYQPSGEGLRTWTISSEKQTSAGSVAAAITSNHVMADSDVTATARRAR